MHELSSMSDLPLRNYSSRTTADHLCRYPSAQPKDGIDTADSASICDDDDGAEQDKLLSTSSRIPEEDEERPCLYESAQESFAKDPFRPFPLPGSSSARNEKKILTFRALLVGISCGALVNASNIYLGLRAGWTSSANIFGVSPFDLGYLQYPFLTSDIVDYRVCSAQIMVFLFCALVSTRRFLRATGEQHCSNRCYGCWGSIECVCLCLPGNVSVELA